SSKRKSCATTTWSAGSRTPSPGNSTCTTEPSPGYWRRGGRPALGAPPPPPSRIDPYLPFILATLEKFPTLTASRLYGMVHERGYAGGPDHFRHLISRHRPRPKAEAYLRLRTLSAEP